MNQYDKNELQKIFKSHFLNLIAIENIICEIMILGNVLWFILDQSQCLKRLILGVGGILK